MSREHVVARTQPGLVSVAGGKYTTYRVMAADAIHAAGPDLDRSLPPSVTDRIPLLGADGYPALLNQVPLLASRYDLPPWTIQRLLGRYGSLLDEVLAPTVDEPALLQPVPGAEAAEAVAATVNDVLGWDEHRHAEEVRDYTARVAAERRAQTEPDDATAHATRLAAPDSRTLTALT